MRTVPRTSFEADAEQIKLFLNLLDVATEAVRRRDFASAMLDLLEAERISNTWPGSSIAGHIQKRLRLLLIKLRNYTQSQM